MYIYNENCNDIFFSANKWNYNYRADWMRSLQWYAMMQPSSIAFSATGHNCCLTFALLFVIFFICRPLHATIYGPQHGTFICVAKQQIAWWPSVTLAHMLLFPIRYIALIPIKLVILRVITITVHILCIYLLIIAAKTLFELTKLIIVITLECLFYF